MNKPVHIKKHIHKETLLDFSWLRKEGIKIIQDLAGDLWTDFNDHDPGVTILEQLCYALTDLGYRVNFDIEEILKPRTKDKQAVPGAFFDSTQILPTSPWTSTDYRILFLDRIPALNNVWVETVKDHPLGVNGLYRVKLELSQEHQIEDIKKEIRNLYLRHRNLGEDIAEIQILKIDKIQLEAVIDIDDDAIAENILANIFLVLEKKLIPRVEVHSREELEEEGLPREQIFDGPLTTNGFIKATELHNIPSEIYISDLIGFISDIEGIKAIRELHIIRNNRRVQGDVLLIQQDHVLSFDPNFENYWNNSEAYPIRFFRGGININVGMVSAEKMWQLDKQEAKRRFKRKVADLVYRKKKEKLANIGEFFSLQNGFPKVYGIGKYGLPHSATIERKAQAKQLKAYLLFFEQIIADFLAQLDNVDQLFSIDETVSSTYFTQVPADIPQLATLLKDEANFEADIGTVAMKYDSFIERRNRFLNHLLCRFNENLDTASLLQQTAKEGDELLIQTKTKLLRNYPEFSTNRSVGFNYSLPLDENFPKNKAVIHKKMEVIFDLKTANHQPPNSLFDNFNFFETPEDQLIITEEAAFIDVKNKVSSTATQNIIQNEELDYTSGFIFYSDQEDLEQKVLDHGAHIDHYQIIPTPAQKNCFAVLFTCPDATPIKVFEANTEEACIKARNAVIKKIRALKHAEQEDFYLVEHVLLRPLAVEKYRFQLAIDSDNFIEGYTATEISIQRQNIFNLKLFGSEIRNYYLEEGAEPDTYLIILKDDNEQPFAKLSNVFTSRKEAAGAVFPAIEFLKIQEQLELIAEIHQESHYAKMSKEDSYSFQLSIILPTWPTRFRKQQQQFRSTFEAVFNKNAPAQLKTQFLWLNLEEMLDFEELYANWRIEKAKGAAGTVEKVDKLSSLLLEFIKKQVVSP